MNIKNQNGVSLIAAVFIIVVLAFMSVMFLTMVNTGSFTAVNDIQSAQALYVAEGGVESAVASLTTPTLANRIACGTVTGNANLTNEPLGQGQFKVIGASVYSAAPATLTINTTITATTINVNQTAGYATSGRIMIDRELIDYYGITPGAPGAFTNAVRGRDGTFASAHANGANVGQDQCTITSTGGVPTVAAPSAQRQVTAGAQLQEGWIVGAGGVPNNNINGAFCTNATNCWAVGAGGVILHWDGIFWDQAVSPTVNALNEVNCVKADPNNCWAAGVSNGTRPTILRWNSTCDGLGTTGIWNDCTSLPYDPTKNVNLNSVFMISSTDGWAVGMRDGTRATAFRWKTSCAGVGGGPDVWNDCTSAPTITARNQDLNSVFILPSNTDGWAVGTTDGTRPTVYRWKTNCNGVGTTANWNDCSAMPYVQNKNVSLNSVFMFSTTDGWAVGTRDGARATAFRWKTSCAGVGGGPDVWNDCTASVPAGNFDLNSVFILPSNTDGWAVGTTNGTLRPIVYRWNTNCNGVGTTNVWNNCSTAAPVYVPAVNQNLNAVVCNAANDCWAFGNNGTIMHWNGIVWALQQQATATLLRWNGITWTDVSGGLPASVTNLNSVSVLSYADGWSAGASTNPGTNKATMIRWNGSSWTDMASSLSPSATQNLNSISMVSSTDGFAVGNNLAAVCGLAAGQPEILRWNGAAWTCVAPPNLTGNNVSKLTTVIMIDANFDGSADDGWAFGNNQYSTQLRWNNNCGGGGNTGIWADCTAFNWVTQGFNAVSMVTPTYGWAVGDLGTNVAGAQNIGLPSLAYLVPATGNWVCPAAGTWPATHVNLEGVFMISFTDGWAVGASNGARPAVFRWDTPCGGGALTNVWNDCTSAAFVPAINQQLNSVYCVDANDCWAVGNAGVILHWAGSTWSQVQAGLTPSNLMNVYIIGPKQRPQAAWQDLVN